MYSKIRNLKNHESLNPAIRVTEMLSGGGIFENHGSDELGCSLISKLYLLQFTIFLQ